jgi:hypothetical protein
MNRLYQAHQNATLVNLKYLTKAVARTSFEILGIHEVIKIMGNLMSLISKPNPEDKELILYLMTAAIALPTLRKFYLTMQQPAENKNIPEERPLPLNIDPLAALHAIPHWQDIAHLDPIPHLFAQEEDNLPPMENPAINQKKLYDIGFPLDLIPEEFTCAISSYMMDDPIIIPTSSDNKTYHWEKFELKKAKKIHGFIKNPYDPSKQLIDLKPNTALKTEINNFVNSIVVACDKAHKANKPLTNNDYKEMVNAALLTHSTSSLSTHASPSIRR